MTNRIRAVFERGVFRPVEPVSLEEGADVELSYQRPTALKPPQPLVAAIEEIARMPLEGPDNGFSGADHDQVLYGKDGAWRACSWIPARGMQAWSRHGKPL